MSRSRQPTAPATAPLEEKGPGGGAASDRGVSWRGLMASLLPLSILAVLIALEVPLCPARGLLGIPCPGCGLTRATEAMMTGDLSSMLRLHPLAPLISPLVAFAMLRATLVHGRLIPADRPDPLSRVPPWVWGTLAALLVGLWLARLSGAFGGLPDPVDPSGGLLYRGITSARDILAGL